MGDMWLNLRRIVRSGFISYWRNSSIALASVTVLVVTLFVVGAIIISRAFLVASLQAVIAKVDVGVYFVPAADEAAMHDLEAKLRLYPGVKSVTFRSRTDELKDFRERHKDNALILDSLAEVGNPLGARLNITAHDPSHYETIANFLKTEESALTAGLPIIDHVSFKADTASRLLALMRTAGHVGLAITLVLIFASIVVTFNTIALAIYSAREEITVMRLVGAENSYIRGPFVLSGVISGVLAALVAMTLLYPATLWLRRATISVYGGIDLLAYYQANFGVLLLILLITGVVLGMAASFLAVRKYLRV